MSNSSLSKKRTRSKKMEKAREQKAVTHTAAAPLKVTTAQRKGMREMKLPEKPI